MAEAARRAARGGRRGGDRGPRTARARRTPRHARDAAGTGATRGASTEEAFATRNATSAVSGKGFREETPKTEKGADAGGSGASPRGAGQPPRGPGSRDVPREERPREADEANCAREEAARRPRSASASSRRRRRRRETPRRRLPAPDRGEGGGRASRLRRAELSDRRAASASRARSSRTRSRTRTACRARGRARRRRRRGRRAGARGARGGGGAARALAEEREAFRRRWKAARAEAEERESAHRLEKATWEDTARMARRERYAAASGTDLRTGTAAREAERETVGADGEGRTSGGEAEPRRRRRRRWRRRRDGAGTNHFSSRTLERRRRRRACLDARGRKRFLLSRYGSRESRRLASLRRVSDAFESDAKAKRVCAKRLPAPRSRPGADFLRAGVRSRPRARARPGTLGVRQVPRRPAPVPDRGAATAPAPGRRGDAGRRRTRAAHWRIARCRRRDGATL